MTKYYYVGVAPELLNHCVFDCIEAENNPTGAEIRVKTSIANLEVLVIFNESPEQWRVNSFLRKFKSGLSEKILNLHYSIPIGEMGRKATPIFIDASIANKFPEYVKVANSRSAIFDGPSKLVDQRQSVLAWKKVYGIELEWQNFWSKIVNDWKIFRTLNPPPVRPSTNNGVLGKILKSQREADYRSNFVDYRRAILNNANKLSQRAIDVPDFEELQCPGACGEGLILFVNSYTQPESRVYFPNKVCESEIYSIPIFGEINITLSTCPNCGQFHIDQEIELINASYPLNDGNKIYTSARQIQSQPEIFLGTMWRNLTEEINKLGWKIAGA